MTEEGQEPMERYGITAAQETAYLFDGAKCRDLGYASNYAKRLAKRQNESIPSRAENQSCAKKVRRIYA